MALDQWRPSEIAGGEFRQFPNEIMLKVILGRYTAERVQVSAGVSVLDVGCFRGNNMVPFFDRGCKCHGVEINADMVADAAARAPYADIREGTNRALPYPDGHFDLLLSINTVHYETSLADVRAALMEFRRVLKPTGRAFIMTHGPTHFIQATARHLGDSRMEVRMGDFRDGTIQTAFTGPDMLRSECSNVFSCVEVGQSIEQMPVKSLHFLWALVSA